MNSFRYFSNKRFINNIRVFIDCDNISSKYFPIIYNELSMLRGSIQKVSLYCDWTKTESNSWLQISKDNGFEPVLALKYARLKESSDMRMAADMLGNYYNSNLNIGTYCIVSNDTDFIHIINILKNKSNVVGIGFSTGNNTLINTYSKFISLDLSTFIDSFIYKESLKIINAEIKKEGLCNTHGMYDKLRLIYPYFCYKVYGYNSFKSFIIETYGNNYKILKTKTKLLLN